MRDMNDNIIPKWMRSPNVWAYYPCKSKRDCPDEPVVIPQYERGD